MAAIRLRELTADRLARAALSRVFEPADPVVAREFGELSPEHAWERLGERRYGDERWHARAQGCDPASELARAAAAGIDFITPADPEWPAQVDVLADITGYQKRGGRPYGLWVRGAAGLMSSRSVAMVGMRACSSYGTRVAEELAGDLSERGLVIVSGGAFGIDIASHCGAMAVDRPTAVVLACGVDLAYPSAHTALFERVVERGGLLVSEVAPGMTPTRIRFLTRNRVIAALTLGTVVVEAGVRSGAMNTARWAAGCARPVMAVPGPVTSSLSAGPHLLIRERDAELVTSAADVAELLGPLGTDTIAWPSQPPLPIDSLSTVARQALEALPATRSVTADELGRRAGLTTGEVAGGLIELTGQGLVVRAAGMFRLARAAAG